MLNPINYSVLRVVKRYLLQIVTINRVVSEVLISGRVTIGFAAVVPDFIYVWKWLEATGSENQTRQMPGELTV